MTYDAGSIMASADLNKDPFLEGLRQCQRAGNDFARQRFTASAALDTLQFRKDMVELQRLMARLEADEVVIRARADTKQAEADLAALRAAQKKTDDEAVKGSRTRKKAVKEETEQFGLLRNAIEQLGPPLVPLAGGVAALSFGVVGLGLAGITTFKGIGTEIKNNTALGAQYRSELQLLQNDFAAVSKAQAQGFAGPFSQTVSKLNAQLPSLNGLLGQSTSILGDMTSHLVGGLIGGLQTFSPLIIRSETDLDRFTGKFEQWATSSKADHFMQTLTKDLNEAEPALAALGTTVVHVFSAVNTVGGPMLETITDISKAINKIPVPVLAALLSTYIGFRTVGLATAALTAAAKALKAFAAAEVEAAAAGGLGGAGAGAGAGAAAGRLAGLAGGMSLFISKAIPYVAAWTAVAYATSAGSKALGDYEHQGNSLKAIGGSTLKTLGDFIEPWNWSKVGHDAGGYERQQTYSMNNKQVANYVGGYQGGQGQIDYTLNNASQFKGGAGVYNGMPYQFDKQAAGIIKQYHQSQAQIDAAIQQTLNDGSAKVAAAQAKYQKAALGTDPHGKAIAAKEQTDAIDATQKRMAALMNAKTVLSDLQSSAKRNAAIVNGVASGVRQSNLTAIRADDSYAVSASSYSTAITNLGSYEQALSKTTASQKQWNDIQIQSDGTVKTNTKSQALWAQALKDANGNVQVAVGLIKGHQQAYTDDLAQMKLTTGQQARLTEATSAAGVKYKLSADQVQVYGSLLGVTSRMLADGVVSSKDFSDAVGVVAKAVANGSTAVQGWVAAVAQFTAAQPGIVATAQVFGAALVAAQGDTISYQLALANAAAANQTLVTAMANAKGGVIDWKNASIDASRAGAQPLLAGLSGVQTAAENAAMAVLQHETSLHKASAASDAFNVFQRMTQGALEITGQHFGVGKKEADAFATTYFGIANAKDLKKHLQMLVDTSPGNTAKVLGNISADLDIIAGKTKLPALDLKTGAAQAGASALLTTLQQISGIAKAPKEAPTGVIGGLLPGSASGTNGRGLPAGFSAVGEGGKPEIAHHDPATGRTEILSNRQSNKLIAMTGWRFPGFAGGTSNDGNIFNGVDYSKTSSSSSGSSSGGASAANLRTLLVQINAELSHMIGLGAASAAAVTSVENALYATAVKAQGYHLIPSAFVAQVKADNVALSKEVALRDKAKAALGIVTSDAQGIEQGLRGAFDIGTSGSGYRYGILSTVKTANSDQTKFNAEIEQAKKLGLNKDLIKQLVNEGPAVAGKNLEAIIGGGKGYVSQIDSAYAAFMKSTASAALTQAKLDHPVAYAESLKLAGYQKETNKLVGQLVSLTKDLDTKIVTAIRRG